MRKSARKMQIYLFISKKITNFASAFSSWRSYAVPLQRFLNFSCMKTTNKSGKKASAGYLIKCYTWLVEQLSCGPKSRTELDQIWADSGEVNDDHIPNIPESTFHRWRAAVNDMFGIEIKCNDSKKYYIDEAATFRHTNVRTHMLHLLSINNLLNDSKGLQDKIIFESVPSGEQYLAAIIRALRDQCAIQMTYQGFGKPRPATFIVEPYCLKMFKQRWYVLAHSPGDDKKRVYGLDRIHAIEPTTQKYKIPNEFDAEFYFRNAYGVTVLDKQQPEQVIISIDEGQADFLRTLPLHPSQKEIEPINGYPAFSFYLYPSDEFCQELFKYGSDLEVHEPESLRKYFAEDAKKVNKMYNLKK